jgi:hypothetical protein
MPINLDELDLSRLLGLAQSFLERLEHYQRHAAAAGFRVTEPAAVSWMRCHRAALEVEAELARLGLAAEAPAPLATDGSPDRTEAIMGLRGLLLHMRGEDVTRWGEAVPVSGVWGAVAVGAQELPDLISWLGQLRELTTDLVRLVAVRPSATDAPADHAPAGANVPTPRSEPAAGGEQLTSKDVKVLLYLFEMHPRLCQQPDIVAGTELSRGTVSKSLKALRSAGLVHRPKGGRKGDGLTDEGKRLAEHLSQHAQR